MATIEFIGHVRLAFQGEREGTAALTCGQRDTWTWVNTDNAGAILGVPISLPKGTKMADITAAVGILLIRHETLRTTFVSTDATTEPVQSVAASGEFLIDVHRIVTPEPGSDLDTFYSDVEASLVSELRAKGLNLAVDPSFRVAVAIQDDIPRAAAIAASQRARRRRNRIREDPRKARRARLSGPAQRD